MPKIKPEKKLKCDIKVLVFMFRNTFVPYRGKPISESIEEIETTVHESLKRLEEKGFIQKVVPGKRNPEYKLTLAGVVRAHAETEKKEEDDEKNIPQYTVNFYMNGERIRTLKG